MPKAKAPKKPSAARWYVIAESRDAAKHTCELEWGWKRAGAGWKDTHGHTVFYASEHEQLKPDSRVYLGHKWYAWLPPHLWAALKAERGLHEVYPEAKSVL